jgi:hypothetical protein
MIPPITTVPPLAIRILVSAPSVSSAGTPSTRGIAGSIGWVRRGRLEKCSLPLSLGESLAVPRHQQHIQFSLRLRQDLITLRHLGNIGRDAPPTSSRMLSPKSSPETIGMVSRFTITEGPLSDAATFIEDNLFALKYLLKFPANTASIAATSPPQLHGLDRAGAYVQSRDCFTFSYAKHSLSCTPLQLLQFHGRRVGDPLRSPQLRLSTSCSSEGPLSAFRSHAYAHRRATTRVSRLDCRVSEDDPQCL